MKKVLYLFLLIPILVIGQTKTIKAELFDFTKDKIPAYCGYQKEWGILKFKILESTNEFRKGDFIFAFFACPREYIEKIGPENFINFKECLLTIGSQKIPSKDINRRAVEMFYKEGNESLPIYGFINLEIIK